MEPTVEASAAPARRVISYTRFSSRKQAKGLSYTRQIEAARDWCVKKGYDFDKTEQYDDKGLSAFSGANSETGALAELQEKLRNGEIARGSILIVEALDRITRQTLSKAITLLMSLVNSGLTVVTLSDGKEWDEASMSDLGSFMMSVVTLYRGHQESEYKSKRLRATFKKHRELGSTQGFGSAPGWLSREDKTGPWIVDEIKVAIIRKVFELSSAGFGSKAISARAKEEGWPVPTRLARTGERWHGQMAGQILRNRAVLGEHQHRIRTFEARAEHWKGTPTGPVIKDYYPRIISDELWMAARASIDTRMVAKRRDSNFYNIFSTLMYCGCCGAPIHRKNERKGYSRAQLSCADSIAGSTQCKTMSAICADPQLLRAIFSKNSGSLTTDDGNEHLTRKAVIEAEMAVLRKEQDNLMAAILNGVPLPGLKEKAEDLEERLYFLDMEWQTIEVQLYLINSSPLEEVIVDETLEYLYVAGDEQMEKRASLHLKLTRLVECVWIWAYDLAMVKFKGEDELMVVELMHKQLPSRANPSSKYHKQPPPRLAPEKPFYNQALVGELIPPTPRGAAFIFQKKDGWITQSTKGIAPGII